MALQHQWLAIQALVFGNRSGEGGIRTLDALAGIRDFQSRALDQTMRPLQIIERLRMRRRLRGASGIRTHEAHHLHVFETCSFNHSDIAPSASIA